MRFSGAQLVIMLLFDSKCVQWVLLRQERREKECTLFPLFQQASERTVLSQSYIVMHTFVITCTCRAYDSFYLYRVVVFMPYGP